MIYIYTLFFTILFGFQSAVAALPECKDQNRKPMRENNRQVLDWKRSSKNQFKSRALIVGELKSTILNRGSHLHLQVDLFKDIGDETDTIDHIEIVYNKSFGNITNLQPGAEVVACGDYITAREKAGNYPPSPMGAIVHWVHASNNPQKHSSGYLLIDGELYGYEGDGEGQVPGAEFNPYAWFLF
ncbi:MAG: hypothetical protein M9962_01900 [Oligoflexia bacterium]|nr:hypothetical protein [Oligoflexia bacterium]